MTSAPERAYLRAEFALPFLKPVASRNLALFWFVADGIPGRDAWIDQVPLYAAAPRRGNAKIPVRKTLIHYTLRRLGLDPDSMARGRQDQHIDPLNRDATVRSFARRDNGELPA